MVGVGDSVGVGVSVGVGDWVGLGDSAVGVGDSVGAGVSVGVGVSAGLGDSAVGVGDSVGAGDSVRAGDRVGLGTFAVGLGSVAVRDAVNEGRPSGPSPPHEISNKPTMARPADRLTSGSETAKSRPALVVMFPVPSHASVCDSRE